MRRVCYKETFNVQCFPFLFECWQHEVTFNWSKYHNAHIMRILDCISPEVRASENDFLVELLNCIGILQFLFDALPNIVLYAKVFQINQTILNICDFS